MERRSFFKMLGLGVAAVVASSVLDKIAPKQQKAYKSYVMGKDAMIAGPDHSGWVSYKFHMTTSLPPNAAKRIRYIKAVSS